MGGLRAPTLAFLLLALVVSACGALPANAHARSSIPRYPTRLVTILAALTSDQVKANTDLAGEKKDIHFADVSLASQRCYILFNNVRYDVEQSIDRDARADAVHDAQSIQVRLTATWHELVNLQRYEQDFSNNGVRFGWATAAIRAMWARMTATAAKANRMIATVNDDVTAGYQRYQSAWKQWNCPASKLLNGPPVPVSGVKIARLPKPNDP